jgi:hypothetical protein
VIDHVPVALNDVFPDGEFACKPDGRSGVGCRRSIHTAIMRRSMFVFKTALEKVCTKIQTIQPARELFESRRQISSFRS